jgi:hypothetical protein
MCMRVALGRALARRGSSLAAPATTLALGGSARIVPEAQREGKCA